MPELHEKLSNQHHELIQSMLIDAEPLPLHGLHEALIIQSADLQNTNSCFFRAYGALVSFTPKRERASPHLRGSPICQLGQLLR